MSNASAMGSADPAPLPSPGGSASFSLGGSGGGSGGTGGPSGQAGSSPSGTAQMAAAQQQAGVARQDSGAIPSPAAKGTPAPPAENVASGRIGPDLSEQSNGQGQGSGLSASISGAGGNDMAELGKQIGKLADHLEQSAPKKPGLRDRLAEANRHMEKEQDRVHVSINPHHHD